MILVHVQDDNIANLQKSKYDQALKDEILELKKSLITVFDALEMYKQENKQLETELAAIKLQQDNGISSVYIALSQHRSDAHKQYMDDAQVRRKQLDKLHIQYMDDAQVRREEMQELHASYCRNKYVTMAVGAAFGLALLTVSSRSRNGL